MHDRHLDLLDWFRGRHPWRKLRNLIDGLPSMGSHYGNARRNDPEVVEAVVAMQDEAPVRWRPAAADWSLDLELQAAIFDRLGQVISLLADLPTGVKKRNKPPRPHPRPLNPIEEAKARKKQAFIAELEDDVRAAQARWLEQQGRRGSDA